MTPGLREAAEVAGENLDPLEADALPEARRDNFPAVILSHNIWMSNASHETPITLGT